MKLPLLSALATSLLALPLAAQRPAAPLPPPPPAADTIQPASAAAPADLPDTRLSLADTDCAALDARFRLIATASAAYGQLGQMQLGYNPGAFPYSRICSYTSYSLEIKCAQIGSRTVRISIDIPEGARNEKNWPQFLKAMGLPADVPRPDPEKAPEQGSLWIAPQPGRNLVVIRQSRDSVPQLIIGSRAVYSTAEELATDLPGATMALEEFEKVLGKP